MIGANLGSCMGQVLLSSIASSFGLHGDVPHFWPVSSSSLSSGRLKPDNARSAPVHRPVESYMAHALMQN
jgi:hypothetical protein